MHPLAWTPPDGRLIRHRSVAICFLIRHVLKDRLGVRMADEPVHLCQWDWKCLICGC